MNTWYNLIKITLKNDKKSVNEIAKWINSEYAISSENLMIDDEEKTIKILGNERECICEKNKKWQIPTVEDLFYSLSKQFQDLEYNAYAEAAQNISNELGHFYIEAKNNKLKIGDRPVVEAIYCDDYDDYDEFLDEFDYFEDLITEKMFKKYQQESVLLYVDTDDSTRIYTEKEYNQLPIRFYFEKTINSTSNNSSIDLIEEKLTSGQKIARQINDKPDSIIVNGKNFVHTYCSGEFSLEECIKKKGGVIKSAVSSKVDYLIIGDNCDYDTSKVKSAKEFKKKGSSIIAISQSDFEELIKNA